ncbi:MAG TPA: Ig-like domain-containing protein [Iamia sp.]|nr:Ig-like domain-containing protein [Iamia sp.]
MTTHAWMAESAIDLVEAPALRALLQANVAQVRSGARFPDGGYGPGNVYGEEAHWQRFADVYAGIIREKEACGDLAAPTGPCAAQVAHLMGIVAHGTGDEVWDWLFEPNSPDLDEYYLPEELSAFQDGGGQELVMDLVAIGVHGRPGGAPPALPGVPDLLAAFAASGQQGVTAQQLAFGQQYIDIVHGAESGWVPAHLAGVRREMPWMSHNLVTAPGGVQYAARAIAGQWDDMWARLLGQDPTTEFSATYPADGQRRIPATGWVRSYGPGSHRDRGGARTRISASLTYALPYRHPGGDPAPEQLPAGAMTLTERDTSTVVPLMAGYPRVVPYGPDAGTHTVALQPAADLAPCTWYRVDVTTNLLDADGDAVTPTAWEFRTGADGAGRRCADDPYTADERWIRAAYQDVLGRSADVGGLTGGRLAADLVGSAESRTLLAGRLYQEILGRPGDAAGRAFWADALRSSTLVRARAGFWGSREVKLRFGGDARSFLAALYQSALGRPAGAGELDFWYGEIMERIGWDIAAKRILASPEAARGHVRSVYAGLLGRNPGTGELAYWAPRVQRADERLLVRAVVGSAEYVGHVTA